MNRRTAQALDKRDPLAPLRSKFNLPKGSVYLCGHSLGAMPKTVSPKMHEVLNAQWGKQAIRGWNTSAWIDMPTQLGTQLAPLLGATPEEIIVTDSTSINLFKVLQAGLRYRPDRHIILTEKDNFPSNAYMVEAMRQSSPDVKIITVPREDLFRHLNSETALIHFSHVHYRSGEKYDLSEVAAQAHAHGALVLCDLSHSVGVMPLSLNECHVDFAVAATYKYLNGGPGAPAALYIAKRHHAHLQSPLPGWMGHAAPFAFSPHYTPAEGVSRFLCGTHPILSMAALQASLKIFEGVSLIEIRKKSEALSDLMITLMAEYCPALQLSSPIDVNRRGSHLAFIHPQAYAITQALLAQGFISDFRTPHFIRLGLSPLYLRYVDVFNTVKALKNILD